MIAWLSKLDDAAARSFALGFYDAVGAFLASGDDLSSAVELAFWAGLERFHADGFRLGDPSRYLHPPGHPHTCRPVLSGCRGCLPPVHGEVALLRCGPTGAVERLAVGRAASRDSSTMEAFSWVPFREQRESNAHAEGATDAEGAAADTPMPSKQLSGADQGHSVPSASSSRDASGRLFAMVRNVRKSFRASSGKVQPAGEAYAG